MLDDLKERLAKAETASEDFRKQAEVLQARLDEATQEQVKYEEKCHETEEQIEALQNEKREATRKIRELEAIYETEHSAMVKDKEEMANREEELQMVIARLKDSLNQQKMSGEDETRSSRSRKCASRFSTIIHAQRSLLIFTSSQLSLPITRRGQLRTARIPSTERFEESVQADPAERQVDRVSAAGTRRGPNQACRVGEPRRRQAPGG